MLTRADRSGQGRRWQMMWLLLCGGCLWWLASDRLTQPAAQQVEPGRPTASAKAAEAEAGATGLLGLERDLVRAIAAAEPSVVAIARVRKSSPPRPGAEIADPTSPSFVPTEYATGVVLDRQGHILTNYHVLGDPEQNDYYVWLKRQPYKVQSVLRAKKVVAGDPWTDLAIVKIDAAGLQPIKLGSSKSLRKGMIVVALGNPHAMARDGEPSASWGIVSNLNRAAPPQLRSLDQASVKETVHHFGTLIQTDARLQLGTSGGALVNLRGEMVGLTTSLAPLVGYESSAGFAIPVDEVFRRVIEQLKTGRTADYGFLGVAPRDLEVAERRRGMRGARVVQVEAGTPAAAAGIRVGDIITHLAGTTVDDQDEVFRELSKLPVEAEIQITLLRSPDGKKYAPRTVRVRLSKKYVEGSRPAYSSVPALVWRGAKLDFATALPPILFRQKSHEVDQKGCISVVQVDAESSAWKAGLRPGMFINRVDGQRVRRPADFFRLVKDKTGPVELSLTANYGDSNKRRVLP